MHGVPYFSVILTTFNRSKELVAAIESVLAQEFADFELIVVDDGSTDNTNEKVSRLADERLIYIKQENKGAGAARNTGIKKSRGGYICFLDDDDTYMPNHLSALHSSIVQNGSPRAMFRTYAKVCKTGAEPYLQEMTDKDALDPIEYIMNNVMYLPTVCIHRSAFEKYLFNEKIPLNIDYEMWLRILREFPLMEVKAYTVNIYFKGNSLTTGSEQTHKNYIRVWKDIFRDKGLSKHISAHTRKKIFLERYTWLAGEQAKQGKFFPTLATSFSILGCDTGYLFSKKMWSILYKSLF